MSGSPSTTAAKDDGVRYDGHEVIPPPLSMFWRKNAHWLRAVPVCRTCAIAMKFDNLSPFPEDGQMCQAVNCENRSAYLSIV